MDNHCPQNLLKIYYPNSKPEWNYKDKKMQILNAQTVNIYFVHIVHVNSKGFEML